MDHDNRRVGKRLKAARKAKGLSLRDVAPEIGISFQFLGELERGAKGAKMDKWKKLSRFYGIPLDKLLE